MSAINQSDSEIVFSSQDLDNSTPTLQGLKITHQSPLSKFNMAQKNRYYEGNPSINFSSNFVEPASSGKKAMRKTSDDSLNDIQARRADQLQKYNVRKSLKFGPFVFKIPSAKALFVVRPNMKVSPQKKKEKNVSKKKSKILNIFSMKSNSKIAYEIK